MHRLLFCLVFIVTSVYGQYLSGGRTIDGPINSGTSGGAANAYTLTLTDSIASYKDRQCFVFEPTANNTGASTLNIDSLGAKSIVEHDASALASGRLTTTGIYTVCYESTGDRFVMQSGGGGGGASSSFVEFEGHHWPFGQMQESYAAGFDTNQVDVYEFSVPYEFPLRKIGLYVEAASPALSCNTSTEDCLLWIGVWNVDRDTLVASVSSVDIKTTGVKLYTFSSTVTLSPGVPYFILIGSESSSLTVARSGRGLGSRTAGMLNQETTKRYGKCTNTTTGTGSTYALPSTCGAVLSQSSMPPGVVFYPGS